MSLGSLSPEAHETLAIAMNRLGGRSNTGEGGEDPVRFTPDPNGDSRRSAIKQVASGRFGVTIDYLVNADQLQIKMAQGAKPGEGGQLPGHKVDDYIGEIRHSTPGVGLISPPPHHDIYSIEDLKQLIYDLRCANPKARGLGQARRRGRRRHGRRGRRQGERRPRRDRGHDGGTGASPLSSIQSAGIPWEIGLAETQQTLLLNDLRSRIVVQTDGQLKTGRDVVVAAMLGADEMGFSTAPLIATGCIMMRVCHLNTCPVGIATQDPELRKRFAGTPEHVINYFFFVAEEVREIMASLGVRTLDELVGRVDLLERGPAIDHWKARGIDLSHLLTHIGRTRIPPTAPRHRVEPPPPVLDDALDWELIARRRARAGAGRERARAAAGAQRQPLRRRHALQRCRPRHGADGLPEGTIEVELEGSAGQSFGGWLAPGVTFTLRGDANDYAGKGLSGGMVAVRPRDGMGEHFRAEENVIVGNTVLYGATGGRAFFRGLAGERFAVRNSGASAVVEGVGDHGCEYMTGGRVVVLGPTGRNFAAGMSGGIAYVLDETGAFAAAATRAWSTRRARRGGRDRAAGDGRRARRRTGSPVAADVLADWEQLLAAGAFVKVMPHDYKRVLRERAEEEAQAVGAGGDRRSQASSRSAPRRWMGPDREMLAPPVSPNRPARRAPDGRARGLPEDRAPRRALTATAPNARTTTASSTLQRPVPELREQGARCMDCGVPFCHNGCPLGNLIPDWNDLVYRDRFADAIHQLHATNNFPEFTGRLCPAPCEAACVLEIHEGDAGHDQADRERDHRPRLGRGLGGAAPAAP